MGGCEREMMTEDFAIVKYSLDSEEDFFSQKYGKWKWKMSIFIQKKEERERREKER